MGFSNSGTKMDWYLRSSYVFFQYKEASTTGQKVTLVSQIKQEMDQVRFEIQVQVPKPRKFRGDRPKTA